MEEEEEWEKNPDEDENLIGAAVVLIVSDSQRLKNLRPQKWPRTLSH